MMTIFVDCDGVLRDLIDKVLSYHDENVTFTKGEYDVSVATGLSLQTFWNVPMEAWTQASPYMHADRLLRQCCSRHETFILTGCLHPDWTKEWIGSNFPWFDLSRVIFCQYKWLLASKGRYLIDDCEAICDYWRDLGGNAMCWPSIGNDYVYNAQSVKAAMSDITWCME